MRLLTALREPRDSFGQRVSERRTVLSERWEFGFAECLHPKVRLANSLSG